MNIFSFGLVHGLGLATKLLELRPHREALPVNLLSFNIGVELGQMTSLSIALALISVWRRSRMFSRLAIEANWSIMTAGFVFMGNQIGGYFIERGGRHMRVDGQADHPLSRGGICFLIASSVIAAGIILIAAILPAEFGIDPLGLGKRIGTMVLWSPAESKFAMGNGGMRGRISHYTSCFGAT